MPIDYPWGKDFACQKFLKSKYYFGGKFKFKFLGSGTPFEKIKLKMLSWGPEMEFFHWLWTLTYCHSLKKSIFVKKKFFFLEIFSDMAQKVFYLQGQKTQGVLKFLELLSPWGDSPWPKEHFGWGLIWWHVKTLAEIEQKLIWKAQLCQNRHIGPEKNLGTSIYT